MTDPDVVYRHLFSLILLIILLCLSAFFSGSETALFAISRWRLLQMQEQHGRKAKRVASLLERPYRLLTTILTGNMIVNILAAAIGGTFIRTLFNSVPALQPVPEYSVSLISVAVMTFIILIFAEVSPKTLAIHNPEKFALVVAGPVALTARIMGPLRQALVVISSFFLDLAGVERLKKDPSMTEQELMTLVSLGEKQGVILKEERKMIEEIFEFEDTEIREILVPRTDMAFLHKDTPLVEAVEHVKQVGYSRVPVIGESVDDVAGILYAKDLIPYIKSNKMDAPLASLLRPAYFVPESKRVGELFREMQKRRVHMAIVVDEYGGTAGLVTMEDLLEEVVGEIFDEYDVEHRLIEKLEDGVYLVDARVDLDDINEMLSLNLATQEHQTVGGLILGLFGKLPQQGEKVEHDGVTFTVEKVMGRRINKVRVDLRAHMANDKQTEEQQR